MSTHAFDSSDAARALGLSPGGVVTGTLRAPGSKSLAQRMLVLAGLSEGETRLAGVPSGADVDAARELLGHVGVAMSRPAPAALSIVGRPPGAHRGWFCDHDIPVGESGTLARFALAALGLCGRAGSRVVLQASGTLTRRSSDPLLDALSASGVEFERRTWPITFRSIGPESTLHLRAPRSSQEASALAIALCAWPDENELAIEGPLPSRPYFEMTLGVLARFGARWRHEPRGAGESFFFRGPLRAPTDPLTIEPDASLGAVALAAACLSGGEVVLSGLGAESPQGDVAIARHLRAFGCRADVFEREIRACGAPLRNARVDLSNEPDLAPVLAIVAAAASASESGGESELTGLDTLPGKESSRIAVLAEGLSRAGWNVRATNRSLAIAAPRGSNVETPLVLDPHDDHRMAFAFALLGLVRPGVFVAQPACVRKSWPKFWRDIAALGARVESLA